MSKFDDEKDLYSSETAVVGVLPEVDSGIGEREGPVRGLQIRHLAMSALAGVIGTVRIYIRLISLGPRLYRIGSFPRDWIKYRKSRTPRSDNSLHYRKSSARKCLINAEEHTRWA
jgi:hypothetical protein